MARSPWYNVKSPSQMNEKQRTQFDKSYASYSKRYDALKDPFDDQKLTKDEYFNEYKVTRRIKENQGESLKSLPRDIAMEQQYERSKAQDVAQFKALKESDIYKLKYEGMSFKQFRQLSSEELEADLFGEIIANKEKLVKEGKMNMKEIDEFISSYYFGSP